MNEDMQVRLVLAVEKLANAMQELLGKYYNPKNKAEESKSKGIEFPIEEGMVEKDYDFRWLKKNKAMINIIVNGSNKTWRHETIFYEDLLMLANRSIILKQVYTVTYYLPKGESGSLTQGEHVIPKEGMIFNVVDTSNA